MTIVAARGSHGAAPVSNFPSVDGFRGLGQGRVLNFPSVDGIFEPGADGRPAGGRERADRERAGSGGGDLT